MNLLLIFAISLAGLLSDGTTDGAVDPAMLDELFPPVPAVENTLSINDMLKMAETQSFAIQKALAEEQKAQAAKEKSRSSFLPNAEAGLSYNGELQILPADERSHRLSGTAQLWVPLINPAGWLNYKVSKGNMDSIKTATELTRRQVGYQLAMAYLQAVSMSRLLDLLRSEAAAIVAQKQIASWRISAGIGSASEELQAQMELISLRKEYSAARLSYIEQCETLGNLLGLNGAVAPVEQEIKVKENTSDEAEERLELTMAKQTVELAEKSLKATKFDWLPSLTSTWQIGATWPLKPEKENTLALGAAINLSIPLFNWATIAAIRSSKAELLMAQIALKEQNSQLQREERLAKENLDQLQTEVALYQEQAQLAAATLSLDMADYQNGRGSALQVVSSRRDHQVAEVQELRQRYSLDIARLTYWQAKGYKLEQIIE